MTSTESGKWFAVYLLFCASTVGACGSSESSDPMSSEQVHEIERVVENRTWEFHAADTSRNSQAVTNLLWPEFTLLANGERSKYDEVVDVSQSFMAEVDTFETTWTEVEIRALSPTSAISSFVFKDRIVMKSGEVLESWGPNTFVWQQRKGEWRVIHTDADHYPLSDG